jgi:uncharacterized protein
MARPKKRRRLGQKPYYNYFGPKGISNVEFINLELDEFEVIKLIDYKNLNQEECANKIGVARTTVQKIYSEARKKIAIAIIEGKTIVIKGIDYEKM